MFVCVYNLVWCKVWGRPFQWKFEGKRFWSQSFISSQVVIQFWRQLRVIFCYWKAYKIYHSYIFLKHIFGWYILIESFSHSPFLDKTLILPVCTEIYRLNLNAYPSYCVLYCISYCIGFVFVYATVLLILVWLCF